MMVSDHLLAYVCYTASCVCVYNLWQPFPLIATDDDDDDDYVDFDTHQKMRTRAPQSLSHSEWNDSRIKYRKLLNRLAPQQMSKCAIRQ